jgi:hypothetical protein
MWLLNESETKRNYLMQSLINMIIAVIIFLSVTVGLYLSEGAPKKESSLYNACEKYGLELEAIIRPNEKTKQIIIQCR